MPEADILYICFICKFPEFLELALQYSSSDNFSNIFTEILPKIYFILGGNKFNEGNERILRKNH
jgi:hypothetical protein